MATERKEFSKRSTVRLMERDHGLLKRYVEELNPGAAFGDIRDICGVTRETVLRVLETNRMERHVALNLLDFLKKLRQDEFYKHLI